MSIVTLTKKDRKAKRPYKCDHCLDIIEMGEVYRYFTGVDRQARIGKWLRARQHIKCCKE